MEKYGKPPYVNKFNMDNTEKIVKKRGAGREKRLLEQARDIIRLKRLQYPE
ncbi:hypothetical protein KAR91_21665 [Candidatus Pacearchaeota archaeon]|nr:hypothetical protein [Candidatus Pacearchaeota archaeon]